MRIALYNLEPNIENTAMMQVSQYHKQQGDTVEFYSPLYHKEYDRIYAFSIFQFTSKKNVTPDMICGGTGFNIRSSLPPEIGACNLDYSIFPRCRTSYLWFSRGCIRQCPFCVVPEKEGWIHAVIPLNLNPRGNYISVMDNNFFANPSYHVAVDYLKNLGQPVFFQQGIDVRLFDDEQGRILQTMKLHNQLYVAFDDPRQEDQILPKIEWLLEYLPLRKIACYVLIGYWSTMQEDLDRVEILRNLGIDPFVMPFNRRDPYQKAFARWVNAHIKGPWKDYRHGKWKGINGVESNDSRMLESKGHFQC
jgi:hypothetical protein